MSDPWLRVLGTVLRMGLALAGAFALLMATFLAFLELEPVPLIPPNHVEQ